MKKDSLKQKHRLRATCIQIADRDVAKCVQYTAEPAHSSEKAARLWRRSAKLLVMAAEWYRLADLGLLSKATLIRVAECYEAVGIADRAAWYRGRAEAVPVYYEDD